MHPNRYKWLLNLVAVSCCVEALLLLPWFVFICPLSRESSDQCTVILTDPLHPVLKHFYPDRNDLFLDDDAPIHRARDLTQRFDEYKKDVNHVLWPSLSPDLNSVEHCVQRLCSRVLKWGNIVWGNLSRTVSKTWCQGALDLLWQLMVDQHRVFLFFFLPFFNFLPVCISLMFRTAWSAKFWQRHQPF